MKKVLTVFLAILMAASLATGCQSQKKNTAQEKASIRFVTWDTASALQAYKDVTSSFNKKYPNITVKVESVPDSYDQKMFTEIAANNAPDVFLWWDFPNIVSKGAAETLDSYINGADGLDLSQYYPAVVNFCKVSGKMYAVPNNPVSRAMFYNKDIFDKAGVSYPKDGWTYDEFEATAKKLTTKDVYGFVVQASSAEYAFQQYAWTFGSDVISKDGKTLQGYMNAPKTAEALQWYANLYLKDKVSPSPSAQTTMGGAAEIFESGKVAMIENGTWPISDMKKIKNFRFGTVTMPSKDGKCVGILHGSGFVVNSQSKNKDAAWKFASFIGGKEGDTEFARLGYALPGMPSVAKELNFEGDEIYKPFVQMLDRCTVTLPYLRTENWSKIDEKFNTAVEAAVLGKASAQDALNQCVKDAEASIKVGQ